MKKKFDIVNEQIILSSMMQDEDIRRKMLGSFTAKDFLGRRHVVIFNAIKECVKDDLKITPQNIAMNSDGDFGGVEYLKSLVKLEVADDLKVHIFRLKQDSTRVLALGSLKTAEEVLSNRKHSFADCVNSSLDVYHVLKTAIAMTGTEDKTCDEWLEVFDKRCAGEMPFVSSGYDALDSVLTDGLAPGKITIVAGRTRTGKSIFLADMVRRQLEQDECPRIGVLPLEGGRMDFMDLLVSNMTGISIEEVVKRPEDLSLRDRRKIKGTVRSINDNENLVILENPFLELENWTNETAMDKMEEIVAEGGYDVFACDLWERSLPDVTQTKVTRAMIRQQYIFYRYNTHGVLAHQILRSAEDRSRDKGKRPSIIELKNSGIYEEISNLILLLHREKVYKPFMRKDLMEVNVAKQKRGEDGVVMVADFVPECCRLENDRIEDISMSPKARMTKEEE